MKEKIIGLLTEIFSEHPVASVTTAGAFILALVILLIGFWATLFIAVLTAAGFLAGRWLEADDQRMSGLLEKITDALRRQRKD